MDNSSNRLMCTTSNNKSKQDASDFWTYTQGPLDSTFGQHAAFPIERLNEHAESMADSAQAYMEAVRLEAENERSIYYIDRPQNQIKRDNCDDNDIQKNGKFDIEKPNSNGNTVGDSITHWKKELMVEFLALKTEIEQYKQSLTISKYTAQESIITGNEISDRASIPTTATAWREYIINNPPPPIKFFFENLNRPTIIKLFIYVTKWLNANTNENLSRWIFLLFLRLDSLLDHIDCSIVRELAKKAIKIKANTTPQDISKVSHYTIDMIISIVGEYYRQRDLLQF